MPLATWWMKFSTRKNAAGTHRRHTEFCVISDWCNKEIQYLYCIDSRTFLGIFELIMKLIYYYTKFTTLVYCSVGRIQYGFYSNFLLKFPRICWQQSHAFHLWRENSNLKFEIRNPGNEHQPSSTNNIIRRWEENNNITATILTLQSAHATTPRRAGLHPAMYHKNQKHH